MLIILMFQNQTADQPMVMAPVLADPQNQDLQERDLLGQVVLAHRQRIIKHI